MKIPFLRGHGANASICQVSEDFLENKKKLESKVVSFLEQASVIIPGTYAKKEKAREPFVLLVTLGKLNIKGALADLVASTILMLMTIAKKPPFKLKPSRKTIQLADCSIKLPCWEFEDLPT